MPPVERSVRVQQLNDDGRTVLQVTDGDQRSFRFGERVRVQFDDGSERPGSVGWDPVHRWVVRLEEQKSPFA